MMTDFPKKKKKKIRAVKSLSAWAAFIGWRPSKKEVAMTPQGMIPIEQVRASGQIYSGPKGQVAPCTLGPNWQVKPANWWCGQWKDIPHA